LANALAERNVFLTGEGDRRSMNQRIAGSRIAYVISPHGFGHAARASAVITALQEVDAGLHVDVFTSVPSWFFEDSLPGPWAYHPIVTDVGLVQKTPLVADLSRTVEALDRFLPFPEDRLWALADTLKRLGCELVICDIAPMGIAAAHAANIPSVLVENFTWDWIYEEYLTAHQALKRHADYVGFLFSRADYHIQTEPVCSPQPVDLTVLPVSRKPRQCRDEIRQGLGIPGDAAMVLVTMGGVPDEYDGLGSLSLPKDLYMVVPGAGNPHGLQFNLITLPHRSRFFHPDLVGAADAVVGKVGYSTIAEVYHAGVPFGFIKRRNFRESDILSAYVAAHMNGLEMDQHLFSTGEWTAVLPRLLEMPRIQRTDINGAVQIAEFVRGIVKCRR